MPSAFVTQQLEALVSAFGLPQTDAPLVVSKVTPEFGGRTAGDVRPNHALRAARQIRLSDT
jgi:hypothetical protein